MADMSGILANPVSYFLLTLCTVSDTITADVATMDPMLLMDFLAALFVASLGLYIVYGPGRTGILASDVGFSLSMAGELSHIPQLMRILSPCITVSCASSILYWIRVMNMVEISGMWSISAVFTSC